MERTLNKGALELTSSICRANTAYSSTPTRTRTRSLVVTSSTSRAPSASEGSAIRPSTPDTSVDQRAREDYDERFLGNTLLEDVSHGRQDTVERFLCAVAIRAYVPSHMGEATPQQAFALYTLLPPSLAKAITAADVSLSLLDALTHSQTRHANEARQWAQPWIDRLHAQGYKMIAHMLPVAKMTVLLQSTVHLHAQVHTALCSRALARPHVFVARCRRTRVRSSCKSAHTCDAKGY
jgi:hypothetical protein